VEPDFQGAMILSAITGIPICPLIKSSEAQGLQWKPVEWGGGIERGRWETGSKSGRGLGGMA
jgi:hypothetical protein